MMCLSTHNSAFERRTTDVLLCCPAGSLQSKEVIFPASPSPSFLTVPGEGFAEPFALSPGKWILRIRAEGVLLVSVFRRITSTLKAALINWWVVELF